MNASLAKMLLLVILAIFAVAYIAVLVAGIKRAQRASLPAGSHTTPDGKEVATGFVTNFFDTLGIGSYATTTAIFRWWKLVPDELIPGTLNVGHTLPTIAQAFIFTRIVPVETGTLIGMIVAAIIGAWLGAGVVVKWPRRMIQIGMGTALLGAATLMFLVQMHALPGGGTALGLSGPMLVLACGVNLVLGALMMLGIGLYAPCMILVSLLGMNPTAAFPIMMGSCAFLMPVATARFVREGKFHVSASLGLLAGGIPAVLIAAFIVKSLPLVAVRWLVIAVVVYTAISLIRSARQGAGVLTAEPAPKPT
ncbi:MAG TPA: sulfite exporter TauE/SafE family protein [Gemmatimonadaceae bacterium]|nr:sulfite exporter TauE/SafE family protein [Gemmatimonadaceae bacterium]